MGVKYFSQIVLQSAEFVHGKYLGGEAQGENELDARLAGNPLVGAKTTNHIK